MKRAHLNYLICIWFVLNCGCKQRKSEATSAREKLSRLEEFYSFKIPSGINDQKLESEGYGNLFERSHTVITLIQFKADQVQYTNFLNSFSNKVGVYDQWKTHEDLNLSKWAEWWHPEKYRNCGFFHLNKQNQKTAGELQAYMIDLKTNRLVFLQSVIIKQ